MKIHPYYTTGTLLITAVITAPLLLLLSCGNVKTKAVSTSVAAKRNISGEVIFNARILPAGMVAGFTELSGVVAAVEKKPGETVVKGNTVMTIRDRNNNLHKVAAPESGMIVAINFAEGEQIQVSPGGKTMLFSTGDITRKIVTAQVDETDAAKLHPGDRLLAWGNDSFSLPGNISFINLLAQENNGVIRFKLGGEITDTAGLIKQFGNPLPVKVLTETAREVLSVRNEWIISRANRFYVNLVVGNTLKETEVTTGIKTGEYTEIISGINAGDVVGR
jgi:hypothetical protein